jgi:hypothetical protein
MWNLGDRNGHEIKELLGSRKGKRNRRRENIE